MVFLMRFGRRHPVGVFALVVAILIAIVVGATFSQKSDEAALDDVAWFLWPEWKLFSYLPDWMYTLIWGVAAALLVAFAWDFSG